ncbi:Gfo/Idh/MocA family oxidoreductase [Candidatus Micrarchaeota archaeon]|nr:Gfo/Idh/MocA family oxidoreductase [Candidatus Micrarchaeota archaeon]
MNILVIGCGSIGRRHIKNLVSLGHQVFAADLSEENRKWVEENLKIKTYSDMQEAILLESIEVGWICTPPSSHIIIAKKLLEKKIHVFIEKPISDRTEGIRELVQYADEQKLKMAVGYNLRFNKGILKVKELLDSGTIGKIISARAVFGQYLPDWRPWQNYKESYTAKKSMGGGIILDGSHEIDYIRWLLGEVQNISCVARKISSLEVETEDNADIIYEFKGGAVANIHLDFVRRNYKRECEIVGEKGTIEFVFGERVTLIKAETPEKESWDIKEDHNETYLRETRNFLESIKTNRSPLVNAEEGLKSLRLALDAQRSAASGRTVRSKNLKTVIIVQARMSSKRLAGKSLMDICGKPVIWHVINRAKMAKEANEIVLAISTDKTDDPLEKFAKENGLNVFRGSLENVLQRYQKAAQAHNADIIVRITGDCPLIDPEIIDQTIDKFVNGTYNYVSNGEIPLADGFDVEVFSKEALEMANENAQAPEDREHVTPHIIRTQRTTHIANDPFFAEIHGSIDEEKDLLFVRKVYEHFNNESTGYRFTQKQIREFLEHEKRG